MKTTPIIFLAFSIVFLACSHTNEPSKMNPLQPINNPYPFQLTEDNDQFTIMASIESDDLFKKYYPLFTKYQYEGNGYCWEGHIVQILEKKDKELLDHLDFDPEAGAFFVYADSKETQRRFVNILSPIFSKTEQLEEYIKSADRSRIDD